MSDATARLNAALEGRYRIEREVGSGGMATVFLARDLRHERKVALKVLKPELAAVMGAERFLAEIRTTANLQHPHILPLFDSGEADGFLFYVMPFVEGETLREKIDRESQLPIADAVTLASKVADAIDHAHEQGFIHRDIKPANILLSARGEPLVADFGIALAVSNAGGSRLTETGLSLGTPQYMSPEQIEGAVQDARTDVYALGCITYEMLSGEPPFQAPSAQAVLVGHLAQPVPFLRAGRADVPVGVEQVIRRSLAKQPGERWTTASAFATALTGAITARSRAADERREARRRWTARVGGLLGVGALSLAVWWGSEALSQPEVVRLAVLPASNLTRDPDQDYFVDGVHQALVGELQRAGVSVVARQSVLRFRGSDLPIMDIAAQLGVDAILAPAVAREGDSVLVDVSLYRTSDVAVWSQTFTEPVSGVLGLYRDLTGRLASEIGAALSGEAEARLAERPEVDPQVYELVLRGQHHQRQFTPPDFDLGQQYFERAIEMDSTYAPAYLGLALIWGSRQQAGLVPTDSVYSMTRTLVDRARALDPQLVERDYREAGHLVWRGWEWEAGYAAYRRALELDPDNAETHAFFGQALVFQGHWKEADEHRRRAVDLDPLNPLVMGLSGIQLALVGRFDEAVHALEALAASNPGAGLGEAGLRVALHQLGRHDEELVVARAFHEARRDDAVVAAMNEGLPEGGPHTAFGRAADVLASRWRRTGTVRIAVYYAVGGEWDLALEWIETAVAVRDANVPVIGCLPHLWPLHDDPRFEAVVEGLGLPLLRGETT